ncbi:MAG: AraC family transcriptional regulator [Polyangiaceae bacterium]|nr:AraC family transcriptional regulator [Polyangiaceae bacterium]
MSLYLAPDEAASHMDELPDGGPWLRRTISVLSGADAFEQTPEGLLASGVERTRQAPETANQWTGGMQEHDSLEMAVAISGAGVLDVGTTRFRFGAPAVAVISSGLLHSEGFSSKARDYASVWFGLTGNDRIQVHVSAYYPATGWACPWSIELPTRASARLLPWFRPPASQKTVELEPLRAELLWALADLHREVQRQPKKPRDTGKLAPGAGHRRVLLWVRGYLDRHYRRQVTVTEVAKLTRYSPNYLDALFSGWLGMGIHQYLISRRMDEAYRLCQSSDLAIQAIAASVGYEDAFYFSRAFRRYHGKSPSEAQDKPRRRQRTTALTTRS